LTEGKLWKKAVVEEMDALDKNETWDLVKLLNGRKLVGCTWVFKKKLNTVGKFEKYKVQLVVKGYCQVERVNFGEIFLLLQN